MVIGIIVNGLFAMGMIDSTVLLSIDSLLVFAGLGTIRASISTVVENQEK